MSHKTREGREVEFFCEPLDAAGNVADVDEVELVIFPQQGAKIAFTDADPEIELVGTTYRYRTAELPPGKYVYRWHAYKGGVMIDNKTDTLVIEKLRP